jgi:hypothetical protein
LDSGTDSESIGPRKEFTCFYTRGNDEQTFLSEFLMARHESADTPSSDQSKDDGSTRRPGKDDRPSYGPSVVPSVGLGGCAFLAVLTAAVSVIIFRKVLCIVFVIFSADRCSINSSANYNISPRGVSNVMLFYWGHFCLVAIFSYVSVRCRKPLD